MDKKKKENGSNYIFTRETCGMTVLLFSALIALMLLTGNLVFAGIGKSVCNFMYGVFGYGAYIVVAIFAYLGVWLTFEKTIKIRYRSLLSCSVTIFALFVLVHSITTCSYDLQSFGQYLTDCYANAAYGFEGYTAGGVICGIIVYPVAKATTFIGCYMVFSIIAVLCGYLSYIAIKKDYFSKSVTVSDVKVLEPCEESQSDEVYREVAANDNVVDNHGVDNKDAKKAETDKNNKFQNDSLGRKILFVNDEFAAESYRRNRIFNSDSYFNNPVHTDEDYLKAFSDGESTKTVNTYTEAYSNEKAQVNAFSSYTSTDVPIDNFETEENTFEDFTTEKPQKTYEEVDEIMGNDVYSDSIYIDENETDVEIEQSNGVDDGSRSVEVKTDNASDEVLNGRLVGDTFEHENEGQDKVQSRSIFSSIFSPSNINVGNDIQPDISKLTSRRLRNSNANLFDDDGDIFGGEVSPLGMGQDGGATSVGNISNITTSRDLSSSRESRYGIEQSDNSSFDNTQEVLRNRRNIDVDFRREQQTVHITPPTKESVENENVAQIEKPKHVWKKYVRPTLDLLNDYPELNNINTSEIEENKRVIVETLENSKIVSHVSNVVVGPAVTRYDIVVEDKTQYKNALKCKDTIAISLMKDNLNAYLNYSKGAISIEVPNAKRSVVGLKTILASSAFINAKAGRLAFALGKNVEGECICEDITKMPHLLVAGTTGSGKSICLSSLIISLLYKYGPEELRFILVDPKQSEFVVYDKLPHLMINEIIYDIDKAIKALNWAIKEMERRYELFKVMTESGTVTKSIDEYNSHLNDGEEKLPKIVIILDEFGDLMLQAKKDIETRIIRLVQKSRACGIHLILATQRPSVDCITGLIKSNLPTRIGFKVNSFDDSRTIFDIGGAEKLLGKGDMFFRSASEPDLMRIQGCFVDSPEVQKVISFIKLNNETYFDQDVSDFINKVEETEDSVSDDELIDSDIKIDEVFIKALKKCVFSNSGTASVSMIQRYFPVGYIKACKIIDWMENMNYVTESEGSKPRKVLLSRDEFLNTYGDVDD